MKLRLSSFICLLGLFGCAQYEAAPSEERETPVAGDQVDNALLGLERAPSRGSISAPVTIAVFCDFECPYCKRLRPRLAELDRKYGSNIRVVFKQLPLPMHANGRIAAKASLAAQEQGRFWELSDQMFMSDEPLDRERIELLATRAGLDLDRFRTALDSEALDRELDRNLTEADRVGARGTPTTFINGKKITGAQPIEVFEEAIDEALGR